MNYKKYKSLKISIFKSKHSKNTWVEKERPVRKMNDGSYGIVYNNQVFKLQLVFGFAYVSFSFVRVLVYITILILCFQITFLVHNLIIYFALHFFNWIGRGLSLRIIHRFLYFSVLSCRLIQLAYFIVINPFIFRCPVLKMFGFHIFQTG